jgi:histone deacetylase complex subunit SAP30|tara:strand:+ start:1802 stop:2014 length:213 start_codon:yes stop_codon:yes gene_type:complete
VQNGGTKEELMPAVVRHWNQTIVDEDETLIAFALSLRKQALSGSSSSLGVNRTNATKTLVRAGFKQRARQ